MRSRWQLASFFVLISAALGMAVFALQLDAPRSVKIAAGERSEPGGPQQGKQVRRPAQLPATEVPLPPLANPPPKPLKRNDPTTGQIWFRLLDDDTNRPIANSAASFASFGLDGERVYWADLRYSRETTDSDGVIVGRYRDGDKRPPIESLPEPTRNAEVVFEGGHIVHACYPVADSYEPSIQPRQVLWLLQEFAQGRGAEVIDVRLRCTRRVCGQVVDAMGNPVAGAGVFAVPEVGDSNGAWIEASSCYYENTPDTPEFSPRSGTRVSGLMREEFESSRPVMVRASVKAEKPNAELNRPDRLPYVGDFKSGEYWTSTTDASGQFVISNMPRGTWVVGAWHGAHGFVRQTERLVDRDGQSELTLPDDQTASIELTVEWLGKPLEGLVEIGVDVADPFGCARNGVRAEFRARAEGLGPWVFTIGGLREGFWHICAGGACVAVLLSRGVTEQVKLVSGAGSRGKWRPRVFVGESEIEDPGVLVRRVDRLPDRVLSNAISSNAVDREGWFHLDAGEYEASVSGSTTVQFKLAPGESRESEFRIVFDAITFCIDSEMAKLLGGETRAVMFKLEVAQHLSPADGLNSPGLDSLLMLAIEAMSSASTAEQAAFNRLAPDQPQTWHVPRGVYRWQLRGKVETLEGTVDLRQGDHIGFSLANLPGLAVLICQLPGAAKADDCDVEILGESEVALAEVFETSSKDADLWTRKKGQQLVRDHERNRLLLFSRPGTYAVQLQWNDAYLNSVANVPGVIQPNENEFAERMEHLVSFMAESEEFEYTQICAFSADSRFLGRCVAGGINSRLALQEGQWHLLVARNRISRGRDRAVSELGDLTVIVGTGDMQVDLGAASYRAFGKLRIELAGRAPVESGSDPWWQDAHGIGLSFEGLEPNSPSPLLVVSQHRFNLDGPSRKPTLVLAERSVPPGRYRVIPWPGAPESACKVVIVEPGKETVARFEGK